MRIRIIKSSLQISRILKKGAKVHSRSFALFYIMNTEIHRDLEFAAIAGKSVFKRAVDRNFARRRIREFVRTTCKDKFPGMQFVVMAKRNISIIKYADLVAEFENMLSHVSMD
jgi:ribonuclease P protein component